MEALSFTWFVLAALTAPVRWRKQVLFAILIVVLAAATFAASQLHQARIRLVELRLASSQIDSNRVAWSAGLRAGEDRTYLRLKHRWDDVRVQQEMFDEIKKRWDEDHRQKVPGNIGPDRSVVARDAKTAHEGG
jgi:hypothetical protein